MVPICNPRKWETQPKFRTCLGCIVSPVHKTRRTKAEEEKVKKRKEREVREVEPAAASCNFCSDFRFHGQEKHGYCSVLISGRGLGFP